MRFPFRIAAFLCILLLTSCDLSALPSIDMSTIFPTPVGGGGHLILFTSDRNGNNDLYTVDLVSHVETRLTFEPQDERRPTWSPDGSKIAYELLNIKNLQIYSVSANGSNRMLLSRDLDAWDAYPAWSPNGRYISFASTREEYCRCMYRMDANGENQILLTNPYPIWPIVAFWSPDSTQIAFNDYINHPWFYPSPRIFIVRADGSQTASLSEKGSGVLAGWSPDGKWILFSASHGPMFGWVISIMRPDGSDMTDLTQVYQNNDEPAWSPDGTRIVFVSERDIPDSKRCYSACESEIYVMNADGSDQTRLTESFGQDISPAWSPDGKYIVFVSSRDDPNPLACDRDCDWNIYLMGADGSNPIQLTNNPAADGGPLWQPAREYRP